mmetsp:Transcript_19565/g.40344  ORF Transcript_19565/g.40344 Transcript_19565/m.40344 type:complete len:252 (+) Transcript_19565:268-1023(+)
MCFSIDPFPLVGATICPIILSSPVSISLFPFSFVYAPIVEPNAAKPNNTAPTNNSSNRSRTVLCLPSRFLSHGAARLGILPRRWIRPASCTPRARFAGRSQSPPRSASRRSSDRRPSRPAGRRGSLPRSCRRSDRLFCHGRATGRFPTRRCRPCRPSSSWSRACSERHPEKDSRRCPSPPWIARPRRRIRPCRRRNQRSRASGLPRRHRHRQRRRRRRRRELVVSPLLLRGSSIPNVRYRNPTKSSGRRRC